MIRQIKDNNIASKFLNSVPLDQNIPEGMLVVTNNTVILGWFDLNLKACFPCNIWKDMIEIHAAIPQEFRGKQAVIAGKKALEWLFENTDAKKVFSVYKNKQASTYATLCGLNRNGTIFEVNREQFCR